LSITIFLFLWSVETITQKQRAMKYQVTRTYNNNTDVIKCFETLKQASEMYYQLKNAAGNTARIELEEVK